MPMTPKEMINFLEKTINSLKNRKKCEEIMVPINRLFCKNSFESVKGTLGKMIELSIGHVPVLDENKKVSGVFTAFSLLSIMADRKGEPLSENFSFTDAKKYIRLDLHDSEVYSFAEKNLYVDELKNIFEKTYSGGKRLAMVFITSNGKEDGKLLGTISPWDVLGKEDKF